jgi:hypothetical protein
MKTPAAIPAVHDGADTRPAEQNIAGPNPAEGLEDPPGRR